MSGTSIWLTKDRRKLLAKIFSDYDDKKLTVQERYEFQELKEQVTGKYKGNFEDG